jgi:hypothetical protein
LRLAVDDDVSLRLEVAAQARADADLATGEVSVRVPRIRPMLHLATATGDVRGFAHARLGDGLDPREGRSTGGAWRVGAAASVAADLGPVLGADLPARVALEGIAQGRGVGLVGGALASVAATSTGAAPGLLRGFVEGTARLVPRVDLAGRAAAVHAPPGLRADAEAWRAGDPGRAGALPWASRTELGFGLNRFLPEPDRAVMFELSRQGRPCPRGHDATVRLQAQLQAVL